jgi:hypothetical protein
MIPEHELGVPQNALALKRREEVLLQVDSHIDSFPFVAVHEQSLLLCIHHPAVETVLGIAPGHGL